MLPVYTEKGAASTATVPRKIRQPLPTQRSDQPFGLDGP